LELGFSSQLSDRVLFGLIGICGLNISIGEEAKALDFSFHLKEKVLAANKRTIPSHECRAI
jgi:hypothetical protein